MWRMWWARWSIWIVGCALATAVVIGNAFYQKKQFYPTVVYITKSKPSMAVMYAQALLFVVMLGKFFRKLFFGQLRAAEFEHLVERSWYAVTETCLAFTVFRDDFSPKFLALFTLLLFLKSFHWLAEERVDYMERSPVITWVFHVRVLSLLSILLLMDLYFVNVAYQSTITKGASVQLVFGFEYAILTTIVLNTVAKYVFHVVDMQNETPWENKAVFVLFTEVGIGFIKVILYVLFVGIMVRIYTLPLFALRPTYLALRAFKKALNDVVMSRRAINNMNNLYPDVTPEELANTDNVCIICREEMTGGAKKLPCNHIFHVSCLRSWFQRQQTCPTCRLNVLRVPQPAAAAAAAAGGGGNFFNPLNQFPGFGGQAQPIFRAPQAPPVPPQFQNGFWGGIPWMQNQQQAAAQAQAGAQQQQQQQQQPVPPAGTAAPQEGVNDPQAQPGVVPPQAAEGQNPAEAAAAGGFNFNAARGQFPFMFPPTAAPYMFRPPTPRPGETTSTGATGSSYPFSIPPMPYIPLVPPPPPLLQTTGLSDEDLRRMEGTARDNIEARLRCLRNVQILLDSAVVQMQQYSAVVATLNTPTSPTFATTTEPAQSSSSSTATSGLGQASKSPSTIGATTAAAPLKKVITSASNGGVGLSETSPSSSETSSSSSSSSTVPPSEQDELRKRRLQRFSNQAEPAGGGE